MSQQTSSFFHFVPLTFHSPLDWRPPFILVLNEVCQSKGILTCPFDGGTSSTFCHSRKEVGAIPSAEVLDTLPIQQNSEAQFLKDIETHKNKFAS